MIKPAYPFQIARMERLRELLAVNSSSSAITTEVASAATPTENQGGATMPTLAQQVIEQGIVEEAEARARRGGSWILAEHALDLKARRAGESNLEQLENIEGPTMQTIRLPDGGETVRRRPRETP
ncbi:MULTISPECIES: hypothetical protein [unclassified Bradyrhizobium]|uniref:hypothetical protein n=1 Tax=unclassified Bradyrhizobium TaxID=2631580 RepID=UPI000368284F|nr:MULTISPECIES: hypothetical protein [unclassified Bradyrhizobium]MCK1304145.1 hypothetical protein [Bradyrhizobium sp. 45]